jgi:hypothetical protein
MNTIEETKHTPCNQPFDVLLADIFKAPEKKPDRRQEQRDNPDNDHHFDAKMLALLILMVVVLSVLTASVVAHVYCDRVFVEHSQTSKPHLAR